MLNQNRKFVRSLVAVLATVTSAIWARATIVHPLDVPSLVESSDVIVSGRVISVNPLGPGNIQLPGGQISGQKFLATIAVDETLKGAIETNNLSVEFVLPDAPAAVRGIPQNRYGIFFLQRVASSFKAADPTYPFLPATPGAHPTTGSPLDRVITKLGDTVTDSNATEAETTAALAALATIPGNAATDVLRQALEATSGTLRLHVAAKLVARNDVTGLAIVETALLHPEASRSRLQQELAGSLAGLKNAKAIPSLSRLLAMNEPLVTKSAAIALRQSASTDALEPLSRLLASNDEQVRYYAAVGMGEITKQDEWTPTFAEFHEHEAKYLSYWRQWALANLAPSPSD